MDWREKVKKSVSWSVNWIKKKENNNNDHHLANDRIQIVKYIHKNKKYVDT